MKNSKQEKNRWFYKVCLGLLLLPLLFSLLQFHTHIIPENTLSGDFKKLSGNQFSFQRWYNGQFQHDAQTLAYQNQGMRPSLVRLHNQLSYSLFRDIPSINTLGKEGQIFSNRSCESALGRDFIGDSLIEQRILKLRVLQDYLAQSKNTRLLTIIAPSKPRVFPDKLPDNIDLEEVQKNNYQSFLELSAKYKLDLIDYNPLFKTLNDQTEHPLFPNTGYHWSDYGGLIGFDLLLQIMNERTPVQLERVYATAIRDTCSPRDSDTDLSERMNMLSNPVPFQCIGIPEIKYDHLADSLKPSVLVISDSYWWKIYRQELHQHHFAEDSHFWYYFDEAYSPKWEDAKKATEFPILEIIEKVDFVILVSHEGNLKDFPFGFGNELLRLYQENGELGTEFNLQL